MRELQPSYRGEKKMQAASGGGEDESCAKSLSRRADEIPFAPGERFVDGNEMRAGYLSNDFRLTQPLCVGADFVLDHGGEGVELVRKTADESNF